MTHRSISTADKRREFHRLHASGCFLIPNPWDLGSARFLGSLGFKALATTSSGFAWSRARPDGGVPRDEVIAHLAELASSTDLPLNADFENGYGATASEVSASVKLAIESGVAGLSIEDSTGRPGAPLYDLETAVERLRAARRAIDATGGDTLLVGRAECYLVGQPDLGETVRRLRAYASAGADCLYAPGLRTREEIGTVVDAVAPKPVNLLLGWASELTLSDIAGLGVRRVSVGGALARSAWAGFMRAARLLADPGSFDGFAGAASGQELNDFFVGRADR